MTLLEIVITAGVGYLLGALPFAVIIARACGVNILKAGSGNPGATNVKRICGKFAGNLCFVLDALKGALATAFPLIAPSLGVSFANPENLTYVGFVSAIIGHSFSVFIKFRGGKGVATAIGGLFVIMWEAIVAGLAVWLLIFYTTRYVSLASLAMALSIPVTTGFIYGFSSVRFYIALALAVMIFVRHRSNISRLIRGEENRF